MQAEKRRRREEANRRCLSSRLWSRATRETLPGLHTAAGTANKLWERDFGSECLLILVQKSQWGSETWCEGVYIAGDDLFHVNRWPLREQQAAPKNGTVLLPLSWLRRRTRVRGSKRDAIPGGKNSGEYVLTFLWWVFDRVLKRALSSPVLTFLHTLHTTRTRDGSRCQCRLPTHDPYVA